MVDVRTRLLGTTELDSIAAKGTTWTEELLGMIEDEDDRLTEDALAERVGEAWLKPLLLMVAASSGTALELLSLAEAASALSVGRACSGTESDELETVLPEVSRLKGSAGVLEGT